MEARLVGQAGPALCTAPTSRMKGEGKRLLMLLSASPGTLSTFHREHRWTTKEPFSPKHQSMQTVTAGNTQKGPQSLHQNLKQNIQGLSFGKPGPRKHLPNLKLQCERQETNLGHFVEAEGTLGPVHCREGATGRSGHPSQVGREGKTPESLKAVSSD